MTEPEPLQQINRTYVRFGRRKLSYFAGCDYFRLASHPAVVGALHLGAERYGLNVAASRLTTGNHVLYAELEAALCDFFGADSALLVSTGYATNLVVAQALAGSFSHVLLDERSHLALIDAAGLLECPVLRFQHRNPEAVERVVQRCGPGARLILLTDGLFSHNGSVAPLRAYLDILPSDALLLVDDAHGAGVLGHYGRGTVEHTGIPRDRVIQTVTLSKAFGAYGGAVLGPRTLRPAIMERSRVFLGSTPPPLPFANAALRALAILKQAHGKMQARLMRNADYVKNGLRSAGCAVPDYPGPIVSFTPSSDRSGTELQRSLLKAAIHPPFIKYPGGPTRGYFRFVISSEHTPRQLSALLDTLSQWPGITETTLELG